MCWPAIAPATPPKYSSASAPEVASATSVSWIGLPVSSVSSVLSSRLRARIRSAARRNTRPRSTGAVRAHAFCAAFADATARLTISGVAECTRAITSPVAG